jgi:hypothetical protein
MAVVVAGLESIIEYSLRVAPSNEKKLLRNFTVSLLGFVCWCYPKAALLFYLPTENL